MALAAAGLLPLANIRKSQQAASSRCGTALPQPCKRLPPFSLDRLARLFLQLVLGCSYDCGMGAGLGLVASGTARL